MMHPLSLRKTLHLKNRALLLSLMLISAVLIPFLTLEYLYLALFYVCFSIFIFFYIRAKGLEKNECQFLLLVSFVAFSIRFSIVAITTVFPSLMPGSDAGLYQAKALEIVKTWKQGNLLFLLPSPHFFYYLQNAIVYYLFGYFPSLVRAVNCLIGILAGINIYFISKELFNQKTARIPCCLLLFLPSFLFWQSMNSKEALVVFLLTAIIKELIYLKNNITFKKILAIAIYLILMVFTRNYFGIFLTGLFFIYFLLVSRFSFTKKVVLIVTMVLIFGILTQKASMGFMGIDYLRQFNLAGLDATRKSDYAGGSQVLANISMNTPMQVVKYLPIAFLYFNFSPFPWQQDGTVLMFMGGVENILWYMLFIFSVIGFVYYFKKNRELNLTFIAIIAGLSAFYSISMGNMGLAFRMRAQLYPIYFLYAAYGYRLVTDLYRKKLSIHDTIETEELN